MHTVRKCNISTSGITVYLQDVEPAWVGGKLDLDDFLAANPSLVFVQVVTWGTMETYIIFKTKG